MCVICRCRRRRGSGSRDHEGAIRFRAGVVKAIQPTYLLLPRSFGSNATNLIVVITRRSGNGDEQREARREDRRTTGKAVSLLIQRSSTKGDPRGFGRGARRRSEAKAGEQVPASALRAVGALSPELRCAAEEAAALLVKRGSFRRELYTSSIRTLSERQVGHRDPGRLALAADDAGGNATLSAAMLLALTRRSRSRLRNSRRATSRTSFPGGDGARVPSRVERRAPHVDAPMIKERAISICTDLFVPLTRGEPILVFGRPASPCCGGRRALGRWLVLADVATKAGERSTQGRRRRRRAIRSDERARRLVPRLVALLRDARRPPPAWPCRFAGHAAHGRAGRPSLDGRAPSRHHLPLPHGTCACPELQADAVARYGASRTRGGGPRCFVLRATTP